MNSLTPEIEEKQAILFFIEKQGASVWWVAIPGTKTDVKLLIVKG